ncbi:MAG: transglycosylase SLT domain-containing protein [Prevotellaceae bacterium]|nr:transglycosylase SLT domain-containing protein [Prevotellaceae bacterium]
MKPAETFIIRLTRRHKTKILLVAVCFALLYPKKIADNQTLFYFVKNDCLVVALGTNNNAYFLKNGKVEGYQFELIQKYCNTIYRKPVFILEENIDKRLNLLFSNNVDIVVCDTKTDSILQLENINPVYADENFSQAFWLTGSKNNGLARSMTTWLSAYIETKDYKLSAAKYNIARNADKRQIYISEYDDLIKKYSAKISWDWRLIASLICQESQFIPNAKSRRDALGLMQIRQQTAEFLGFDSITDNEKNIAAGIKLIKFLDSYFSQDSTITETERIKFVLAAYNSGHGKIDIFRKNTEQKGRNPSIWSDVETANSKEKHSENSTVLQKYFLSRETVFFVREILERYEHYKNFFTE